jgi:type IV pilus assembly protein PilM
VGLFKKSNSGPALGIDIGTSSIKVLELTRQRNGYRVGAYAIEPLPRNVVVERSIADMERVAQSLRRAIGHCRSRRQRAVVSLATAHVMSKRIPVPTGLDEAGVEDQVNIEAGHFIPYSLDEVNLDFEVLGPSADNPSDDEVQIAACRRELVDEYATLLNSVRIVPAVVDVDSLATERAVGLILAGLGDRGVDRTIAVLDVGMTTTHLNVLHNRRLVYTRDHVFGGYTLTENIQRRFGLSYQEAEAAKMRGDLPDNYRTDLLEPYMDSLAQEAVRALQFFSSASGRESVDLLLLAGGGAKLPRITEQIAKATGVKTAVADPFGLMERSGSVSKQRLADDSPLLLVACGLAMRGADL